MLKSALTRTALLLAFLLSFNSMAQTPADCPPPAAPDTSPEAIEAGMKNARDHGFLWRIEKDGHASYLYGTVHVGKQEWLYPGPQLRRAIRETDTVALEIDFFDAAIRERINKLMATQKGHPLPEKLQARLRRQAAASCVPYETIAPLSPELQVTTLAVMLARKEGLDPAYGVDNLLAGIGHSSRRQVVSLETPEQQMESVHMGSPRETQAFVDASLKDMESNKALSILTRIAKAWEDHDYGTMENYASWCECLDTPIERKAMKRLLDERNPALAKGIDELHRNGSQVFAAVGSLHLFGPLGLPSLMKQMGYTVEQVTVTQSEHP